jgi:TldD protein
VFDLTGKIAVDKEFLSKLVGKSLSQGGEYADVFIERRYQTSLIFDDGRLEKNLVGTEAGAGVRLIHRGKTAYSFTNDLSEESLMACAGEVCRAVQGVPDTAVSDLRVGKPTVDFHVRIFPSSVPAERKIALLKRADGVARKYDARIKQVTAVYRDMVQDVLVASSDGLIAEDERVYTTAVVQAVASDSGIIQTGYESVGGFIGFELFEEKDIEQLSLAVAKRAVMMLGAKRAPGGRMPVVISSRAGGTMIHEAIGHGLEADLAQQGLSVFSGKVGSRIASELITVIDDSSLPQKRGSFRFDDEGTPSQRKVLVENGILRGYMYDRLSAMKDGKKSTGNGRRESYRSRPIPRMTNTFIAEGTTPPDSIIASLDKGLLVQKMGGGQVNTVTGDFVFDVQEGYLIEKGCVGEPVRGATLTGNGPEILKSIDMVGNDLGFSIGTCGKDSQSVPVTDALPTLRIPEIVVGGAYKS